jgi:glycosyltransferase involved in cell wall biosynthesis
MITGQDKHQALAAAGVLVLPSYAEGMPMSILEAMAMGKPVIATAVGGIPEMISDGVEGFLVRPGDVRALAQRMLQVARDGGLYERMSLAARQRVQRQFSLEGMVDRISALYDSLLGDPDPESSRSSALEQEPAL